MTVTPREDIALMEGYHSPQVDVEVRLNTNEAPEPPPDAFTERLASIVGSIAWNRYPDRGARRLRDALGGVHGVDGDRVFAANGSNEVLQTLLLTFGGVGRAAGVWEPTYALHSHIARITGTAVAQGERSADFTVNLDEVARVFAQASPSVVLLCSPNNPTGVADDMSTVGTVLELAQRDDCLLVVDEAYGQFASSSALDLVADDVPLVVTRTFSKTWSMAAERLGYCVGPRWVIEELHKVVLPYHLDAFKQQAGILAVEYVDEMEARVGRLVVERERLVAALSTLPVDVWPSESNFVLFRPRELDGNRVWNDLVDRSVLVRNCSSWPRLSGCLRVTIGSPDEDDRFLAALEEILT